MAASTVACRPAGSMSGEVGTTMTTSAEPLIGSGTPIAAASRPHPRKGAPLGPAVTVGIVPDALRHAPVRLGDHKLADLVDDRAPALVVAVGRNPGDARVDPRRRDRAVEHAAQNATADLG